MAGGREAKPRRVDADRVDADRQSSSCGFALQKVGVPLSTDQVVIERRGGLGHL